MFRFTIRDVLWLTVVGMGVVADATEAQRLQAAIAKAVATKGRAEAGA